MRERAGHVEAPSGSATGRGTRIESAGAQAGTRDDAGTPPLGTLLWALLGGALVWSLHLLASYVAVAWACTLGAEPAGRASVIVISVVALALTAWSGLTARRWWLVARALDRPTDDAWDARMGERTARVSFLMVVGLVAAILFGLGVLYEGIAVFFVPMCEPGISA